MDIARGSLSATCFRSVMSGELAVGIVFSCRRNRRSWEYTFSKAAKAMLLASSVYSTVSFQLAMSFLTLSSCNNSFACVVMFSSVSMIGVPPTSTVLRDIELLPSWSALSKDMGREYGLEVQSCAAWI